MVFINRVGWGGGGGGGHILGMASLLLNRIIQVCKTHFESLISDG